MTVEVVIDEAEFAEALNQKFDEVKIPVQTAMAEVFELMVRMNIGAESGEFRAEDWSPLSEGYAKKVKRPYATLVGETRQLGGSIGSEHGYESSTVYSRGCEYAAAHQYGEGRMPPRPFFPMTGQQGSEEITEQAMAEVESAATIKLQEILK